MFWLLLDLGLRLLDCTCLVKEKWMGGRKICSVPAMYEAGVASLVLVRAIDQSLPQFTTDCVRRD